MNKKLVTLASVGILATTMLIGCQRQVRNPLMTEPKAKATQFIQKAQAYADIHANLELANNQIPPKQLYLKCAENLNYLKGTEAKKGYPPCQKYLESMVEYAKSTDDFKGMTVDWLTASPVLHRLFPNAHPVPVQNHKQSS